MEGGGVVEGEEVAEGDSNCWNWLMFLLSSVGVWAGVEHQRPPPVVPTACQCAQLDMGSGVTCYPSWRGGSRPRCSLSFSNVMLIPFSEHRSVMHPIC